MTERIVFFGVTGQMSTAFRERASRRPGRWIYHCSHRLGRRMIIRTGNGWTGVAPRLSPVAPYAGEPRAPGCLTKA